MRARVNGEEAKAFISSTFRVDDRYAFDIVRDVPFTMDPTVGPYTAEIRTVSHTADSIYTVKEFIPASFNVTDRNGATVTEQNDTKILTWQGVRNGSTVSYTAQPPHVWPYLYRLGRAEIQYGTDQSKTFREYRPWQLAIDPITSCYVGGVLHKCQFEQDSVSKSYGADKGETNEAWSTWTPQAACQGPDSSCFLRNISEQHQMSRSTPPFSGKMGIYNGSGVGTEFEFVSVSNGDSAYGPTYDA
ncbi:MAG: hypothetical protein SVU32_09595, partial [Candidatus Nanohaloarchaea archaeon]|nr:hypothetical protein [Candidatus Nanohaloarchaea archaeon]